MPTPADLPVHRFPGADGVPLAYRALGEGRPLMLLHGLFSNAWTNWVRPGHAALLAAAGHRVLMPDLRGHGDSAVPPDPAAWTPDILAADGAALVAHLGLRDGDYDLGGYSLGGRTAARMLVRAARPRRAVIAGMGLDGLLDTGARASFFAQVIAGLGTHPRGSPAWLAEAFLRTTGCDPAAMPPLLASFVDTSLGELARLALPVLVLAGAEDRDNGSAAELAAALPGGVARVVPGNHMSAVTRPELARAMADFLE